MNVLHSMPSIQISGSQYLLVNKVTKKLVTNTTYCNNIIQISTIVYAVDVQNEECKQEKRNRRDKTWESLDMDRKSGTNSRHYSSEKILLKIDKVMLDFYTNKVIIPIL